jgi:hypothetical protein
MSDILDPARIDPGYWLYLGWMVLALLAGVLLQRRLVASWRPVARFAVAFLAMRLLLLGNPVVWDFYARRLDPTEVGWRQHDAIRGKRDQFLPPHAGVRYLAVGSSQTGVIYEEFARDRPDLDAFAVAAMIPMDLVLYRDYIDRYRPQRVLLYLSDFDIARRPPPEAMVIAPPQGWRLLSLWSRVRSLPDGERYAPTMAEMLVGEVFPEYKYRFVFRALLDKALWRMAGRVGAAEAGARERASPEQMVRWARESMAPEYAPFNLAFLREFLEHAVAEGVDVVIVEGHYNPLVSTAEIETSSRQVRIALGALADSVVGVTFVPRSEVLEFQQSDYVDLSHVSPEAGRAFAARLLELLERDERRYFEVGLRR